MTEDSELARLRAELLEAKRCAADAAGVTERALARLERAQPLVDRAVDVAENCPCCACGRVDLLEAAADAYLAGAPS